MSGARHIGMALTLGGAIIAMTVLSSGPSEARRAHVKKGHFVGSKSLHRPIGKARRATHKRTSDPTTNIPGSKDIAKDPGVGKRLPLSSQSSPTKAAEIVKGPPDVSLAQDGRTPFPTPTTSTKSPKGLEDWAGTKSPKLPPVVSSEPLPPKSGTKLPPVVGSDPLPPGKLPPGSKTPPPSDPTVVIKGPVVVLPPPPPIRGPSKGDLGTIPVKAPDDTESCDRCAWLKANYDQTGLERWLERYRLCLTWLRAS